MTTTTFFCIYFTPHRVVTSFFFFFQAEDGIRDADVTGVQTCALPILSICDRERAATEYALLTAAYGLTGTMMVAASGYIAKYGGYPMFFWLTVFLGVPALLLLPKVKEDLVAATET